MYSLVLGMIKKSNSNSWLKRLEIVIGWCIVEGILRSAMRAIAYMEGPSKAGV
jgi:hypothetical protein